MGNAFWSFGHAVSENLRLYAHGDCCKLEPKVSFHLTSHNQICNVGDHRFLVY